MSYPTPGAAERILTGGPEHGSQGDGDESSSFKASATSSANPGGSCWPGA